jgi:hypothetical protein
VFEGRKSRIGHWVEIPVMDHNLLDMISLNPKETQ